MQLEILVGGEQYALIFEDYWRQDESGRFTLQVKEVALIHSIQLHKISQLVKQYTRVWTAKDCCRICKKPYQYRIRNEYLKRDNFSVCKGCIEVEPHAIADKKAILAEFRLENETRAAALTSLDLKTKIYLLAAVCGLCSSDLGIIEPLYLCPEPIVSPYYNYDLKIIAHLLDSGCLLPSLNTNLDAIEFDENNNKRRFHLDKFTFEMPWSFDDYTSVMSGLFDDAFLEYVKKTSVFFEICREVQMSECKSFLIDTFNKHDLQMPLGDESRSFFSRGLEKYSVGQICNLIWIGGKNAAACYERGSITKEQAALLVIDNISCILDEYLSKGWYVKPFERSYDMPQTFMSIIVFNEILDIDDGGFKQPLHELLQQKRLLSI